MTSVPQQVWTCGKLNRPDAETSCVAEIHLACRFCEYVSFSGNLQHVVGADAAYTYEETRRKREARDEEGNRPSKTCDQGCFEHEDGLIVYSLATAAVGGGRSTGLLSGVEVKLPRVLRATAPPSAHPHIRRPAELPEETFHPDGYFR
jgi:hypothetical protein